jgi:Skp1 family, tetramerisation domain
MESINTSSTGQKVKILTKEGKEIEVEVDLIIRSVTIKGIIDDMSDLQNENIPLPEITE